MGVKELVVFDPDFARSHERVQWQVFRRVKSRGLIKVDATNADRVRSRVLGCYLRAVGTGDEVRVRLGTGANGETLLATDEEACALATAERDEALAEVQRLRAELTKRGRSRAKKT